MGSSSMDLSDLHHFVFGRGVLDFEVAFHAYVFALVLGHDYSCIGWPWGYKPYESKLEARLWNAYHMTPRI